MRTSKPLIIFGGFFCVTSIIAFSFVFLITCGIIKGQTTPELIPITNFFYWLFIGGFLLIFTPVIISKFNQLKHLKYGDAEIDFEDTVQRLIDKKLKSISEEGTSFVNHEEAFSEAAEQVKSILREEPKAEIEFKLIAISMRYSADFIKDHIIHLAREYPYAKLSWRICLVNPRYIASLFINNNEYNWVEKSESVTTYLNDVKTQIESKELTSLRLDFNYYEAIPQWHGLLIQVESMARHHMYFGRTDWALRRNKKPILKVGNNEYRYFDYSSKAGIRKINLFNNWFDIYENWNELFKRQENSNLSS